MSNPDPSRAALADELADLIAKNEAATSWGAAVGARHERIKELQSMLRDPLPPTLNSGAVTREQIAEIIAPDWFSQYAHCLNNYEKQHIRFQNDALERADEILALFALPRAVQGGAGKTQFLTGWMTDQHDAALSPNTGDGGATERLWCTACGTVTRDRLCDCNRWGDEREPHFVNYADEMQKTAHEQAQEIEAWRQAMREMRDLAIDEKSEAIEMRCYDLIMHGPAVPRSEG